jgi:hypothetical protein
MVVWLRIAGIGLNAIGAIILAWRVKGILDMMVAAHQATDVNIRLLMDILAGQRQTVPLVVGMDEQVARKQKAGIWLLVIGFACIGIGNVLVGVSWYLES